MAGPNVLYDRDVPINKDINNKFGLTHEQIITELLIYLGIGDIIANKIDKVTALLEFGGTNIFE